MSRGKKLITIMDMLDNKKAMIYERDWDCNGAIRLKNATTIERYHELKEQHPDCKECDCFFAFSKQQFAEGIKNIRPLKEGEKLHKMDGGLFGTKDGMDKFFTYYQDRDNRIKAECNPQEVYFYEYNNHESMIIQSPNQKIPDRKTKCVIKTHINIKQNVIFGAKLKPV